jgi:hypothetical protein
MAAKGGQKGGPEMRIRPIEASTDATGGGRVGKSVGSMLANA